MAKSSKGSQFERDLCKRISLWFTKGDDDDLLWRSSNSGGRATIRGRQGKKTAHAGDITHTKPIGRIITELATMELKRGYSKFTIADLLDKPNNAAAQEFEKWIEQVLESQQISGTPFWMLIHRRDRREAMVYFPFSFYKKLKSIAHSLSSPDSFPCAIFHLIPNKTLKKFFENEQPLSMVCMKLDTFLDCVDPEDWKEVWSSCDETT